MPHSARSYTFCAACSSSAFQALGEGVLRLFPVVLLIAASEVAAAGEAHECSGIANTREALAGTTGWVLQELPNAIHTHGALQLKRCLLEMFLGSFEQGCSRLEQLGAECFNSDRFCRVPVAPVQQVDGSLMPRLAFGDRPGACHGFLKAANHAVDQLIGVFGIPSLRIAFNPLVELILQALLQLRQQFELIAALPAFLVALTISATVHTL